MLSVTTYGASLLLLPWAFLRLMSLLPAAETLDLAWVAIHEDRHFYWSVDTRDEWRWFGGRVCRGREGLFQLILDKVVEVGMFDPNHGAG